MSQSRWIMVIVATLTVLGLVVVFDSERTSSTTATKQTVPSLTPVVKTLTEADNGGTATINVGQSVIVRLDTHSGGGYSWSLDSFDKELLRLDKDERIAPESKTSDSGQPIVGASETEQWTFTSLKVGTTTVKLTNFRPFETKPTEPTFTSTIIVK